MNMQNKEDLQKWKEIRSRVPRRSHSEWKPFEKRDPIAILREQDKTRIKELVSLRYERMAVSPFTFYRGAAAVMAYDLSSTPITGLNVQLCGDAHIANFGMFASPERHLVFDINDFDETIPGPWEWDIKRLTASVILGGRSSGFSEKECEEFAFNTVETYKNSMELYTKMNILDLWYSKIDLEKFDAVKNEKMKERVARLTNKAQKRTSIKAMEKLTHIIDGKREFVEDIPIIQRVFDKEDTEFVNNGIKSYRKTLSGEKRFILDRFRTVDIVRKVVGVGSVGTPCFIALLLGKDNDDPLMLQVKSASKSVIEPYVKDSVYSNDGHRIVAGQRLIQSSSDIFLGWGSLNGENFYVRQFWDMKGSVPLEEIRPEGFKIYVNACAKILALSHANTGNRFAISAYIGSSDKFAKAITEFAVKYAKQTEKDHAQLVKAMKNGFLEGE